jgi:hypothetical protein
MVYKIEPEPVEILDKSILVEDPKGLIYKIY